MTVVADRDRRIEVLRAYVQLGDLDKVAARAGVDLDVVIDVVTEDAGLDRGRARHLVLQHDTNPTTRPGRARPDRVETRRVQQRTPAPRTAAAAPTPAPTAAAAAAADPAAGGAKHADRPRRRRGNPAPVPAPEAVMTAPVAAPATPAVDEPPADAVVLDAAAVADVESAGVELLDELPVGTAPDSGEPTDAAGDVDLVLIVGTTFLCRRCTGTSDKPGSCCRTPLTRMQVQLHRVAS